MNSRRDFLSLASLSALGLIPGCASPTSKSGSSALSVTFLSIIPFCSSSDPQLMTPIGGSIYRHLETTGNRKVTLVYSGNYTGSKQSGSFMQATLGFDPRNQRAAPLKTVVTYTASQPGRYSSTTQQFLNGIQTAGIEPLNDLNKGMVPIRFSDCPSTSGWFIDSFTGVGAPGISLSKKLPLGLSVRLKPGGQRLVPALGRQVPTWIWTYTNGGTNRGSQSYSTIYEGIISPDVPGQLISYAYKNEIAGDLIKSSTGSLVSIS